MQQGVHRSLCGGFRRTRTSHPGSPGHVLRCGELCGHPQEVAGPLHAMVSPAKHPELLCMERAECAMGTLFPIFTFFCVKNHDKCTLIKGEDGAPAPWGFAAHRHRGGTEASLIPSSALMGPGQRAGAFARFPRLLAPDLAVISAAAAPWLRIPAGPAKPQCGGIEGTARGWVSIGVCPWGAAGAEGSPGLRGAEGDVSLTISVF